MNTNNQIYKSMGYAYPTSTYAKKLGFHTQGCWYVELVNESGRMIQHIFASREQSSARAILIGLAEPIYRYSHI